MSTIPIKSNRIPSTQDVGLKPRTVLLDYKKQGSGTLENDRSSTQKGKQLKKSKGHKKVVLSRRPGTKQHFQMKEYVEKEKQQEHQRTKGTKSKERNSKITEEMRQIVKQTNEIHLRDKDKFSPENYKKMKDNALKNGVTLPSMVPPTGMAKYFRRRLNLLLEEGRTVVIFCA